jgi:energy-coupling factor transporter transmembrane protein EcfT
MINGFQSSWIVKTGQKWKLFFVGVLGIMTIMSLGIFILSINFENSYAFVGTGVGRLYSRTIFLVIGLSFLLCLFFLIKCPCCGKKPIWKIVNNGRSSDWIYRMITFSRCPNCDFRPK